VTKLFRTLAPMAVAAVVVLAFGGCGGGDDNNDSSGTTGTQGATGTTAATGATGATGAAQGGATSSGGATALKVSADPGGALKFDKSELSAKPGKVTITMDNPSTVPHAVGIRGNGVDKDGKTVGKGGVSTATANLKAGDYEFYCPVDAHAEAGMKGSLTVK
jgi:plastocyanin